LRTPSPPTGQMLFFTPAGVIFEGEIGHLSGHLSGNVIGDMIGMPRGSEIENSVLEYDKTPVVEQPTGSYGLTESDGSNQSTTTQPDNASPTAAGGGGEMIIQALRPEPAATAPSESTRLLRAIGVRADVAATFAERAVDQTQDVIAKARTQPGVRDLAAWVVSALRALPAA
jgi:hypothetical protein